MLVPDRAQRPRQEGLGAVKRVPADRGRLSGEASFGAANGLPAALGAVVVGGLGQETVGQGGVEGAATAPAHADDTDAGGDVAAR
ncbi:hypothetical protein AB0N09_33350 [Streptomyces erythrochromogenes]|uniref:hypothetical protein n=1 Tax=Streptomyces erythrochromogenes TaxID=285574 RepID=UPI00342D1D6E